MLASARLFVRGPVWDLALVVSAVLTAVAVVQVISGRQFWMWLFFAALALVTASFYRFHRDRKEELERSQSLANRIDDLHREGMDLLEEIDQPIEPQETSTGVWSISLDPPSERWDRVEEFDDKVRALLRASFPALLSDYASGINAFRKRQREQDNAVAEARGEDTRSDAAKLQEFADRQHRRPARFLEACLEGLAQARFRAR